MFRKWLLTTVITGGLVAASCGGNAFAQSGKLLHPNSGWAVSKLAAAGTGASPYCALARRFNGNIILTVARNGADESSVAIDFQRQALENGRSYQVTLDPGFKQHRSYNVRPVSGKAMVVRLGQDYAFHDALNRSGKLSIDISGEVYSFHLPDFADGQTQLAGCLAGLVQPAAGKATPTPMPSQSTAQLSSTPLEPAQRSTRSGQRVIAQADIQADPVARADAPSPAVSASGSSSDEMLSLREENLRLRNALERERRVYEDRFMKEGQSSSQVAELSERLQILERENNDLRQQLTYEPVAQEQPMSVLSCAPDENAAKNSAAVASMASEMDLLRNENERLKQLLMEQKAEMALLEQKITTASSHVDTSSAADTAAQDAIIDRLSSRVRALEEENRAMKQAQAMNAGAGNVSLAQLRSLEEQLRYTQDDRDKLARQIANIKNGKGDELMSISSSNWDLEQATQRYNEAEKEIRRLSRQLADQRAECAGEKKELEYMLFDPEVATEEQISKLIDLETQLDDVTRRYEEQASLHEAEIQSLKAKAEAGSVPREQLASLESEIQTLAKEKSALAIEKDLLAQKVASLEASLAARAQDDYQLQALMQEKKALAAERASLERKVSSLEASLAERAQDDHQLQALMQEKKALAAERATLERKVSSLEASLANIRTSSGNSRSEITEADTFVSPQPEPVQVELIGEATPSYKPAAAAEFERQEKTALYGRDAGAYDQPTELAMNTEPPTVGQAMQRAASASMSNALFSTTKDISAILGHAQIPVQGKVKAEDIADGKAFSWDTGRLFGSAEQKPLNDVTGFESMTQAYLSNTKKRCDGEFAAIPVLSEQQGSMRVSTYDIACITEDGGAAASILFYNQSGVFNTYAHETGMDSMDLAMDARDKLVDTLMDADIAMR